MHALTLLASYVCMNNLCVANRCTIPLWYKWVERWDKKAADKRVPWTNSHRHRHCRKQKEKRKKLLCCPQVEFLNSWVDLLESIIFNFFLCYFLISSTVKAIFKECFIMLALLIFLNHWKPSNFLHSQCTQSKKTFTNRPSLFISNISILYPAIDP